MVPNVWIYSFQFEFWLPQLHLYLHLHPNSTCHLNSKSYPLTPDLHWHQYLNIYTCVTCTGYWLQVTSATCTGYWIQATSANKWLHHIGHATLYTTTLLLYPLLTTSILYWIRYGLTVSTKLPCLFQQPFSRLSFSSSSGYKPLGKVSEGFIGQIPFLSPDEQQVSKWHSKQSHQPGNITNQHQPYFIHHRNTKLMGHIFDTRTTKPSLDPLWELLSLCWH